MAWLIEAYLDEGKHGPDHPESLGMKHSYEHTLKKKIEPTENEEKENRKTKVRNAIKSGVYDHNGEETEPNEKYTNSELQQKAKEHEQKAGEAAQKVFDSMNKNEDKQKKAEKEFIQHKNKQMDYLRAADAKDRHDRRHPDRKVQETVDVELLQ